LPRVISSAQTFITKFILPLVVAAIFAFGLSFIGGRALPIVLPVLAIAGWSVYWYYIRLKKVTIEEEGLLISNYVREVRVPWRDIRDVSGSRWVKTRQVKITFDRDTGFGTSIVFMPKFRFLWPGQEHPIAEELRQLVESHGLRR